MTAIPKLERIAAGIYRGVHRDHEFTVRKFLDPHRPRTATRWSGPQQRWAGACPALNIDVSPNTVRRTVVQRLIVEIDKRVAGFDPVFGGGVNAPWEPEKIAKLADEAEANARQAEINAFVRRSLRL